MPINQKQYCKNCQSVLYGAYCSSCGQRDADIHVPVPELISEFTDILPEFDHRIVRSIKPFLLQPGFLTLAYLSGKRKSYLSPFKMYLFISVVFFFVSSFIGFEKVSVPKNIVTAGSPAANNDTAMVTIGNRNANISISADDSIDAGGLFGPSMVSALRTIQSDPRLLFDKMKEHRPKLIFLLMPAFALILKLLYIRSKSLYIKHLVFSFYVHSFIFFIFTVADLLILTNINFLASASGIVYLFIPAYVYGGMKRVYQQSAWKTAVKLMLLSALYAVTFLFGIVLTLLIIIGMFI